MTELTYTQAVYAALREEMQRDERVILMGEDVQANLAGYTLANFMDEFGARRVLNTPLSENGFVGAAVGAALTGLRPVVDMTFASFLYVAMDQFVSQAAKNRYMFGGQADIPVVYRAGMLYGGAWAAHHSDRNYPMMMNVPGLKIFAPSTAYDLKGLLKTAIRDNDPVIFFEDLNLSDTTSEIPDEEYVIPMGQAAVRRAGTDVTVVAIAGAVGEALAAAEELAADGVAAEVIDPRTLVPLDREAILNSVRKTGRLVAVDLAHKTCSAASEIAATAAEEAFAYLKAPIVRVVTPDVQIPFSPALEKPLYPNRAKIVEAVRRVLA